jgi:hypothetical protein
LRAVQSGEHDPFAVIQHRVDFMDKENIRAFADCSVGTAVNARPNKIVDTRLQLDDDLSAVVHRINTHANGVRMNSSFSAWESRPRSLLNSPTVLKPDYAGRPRGPGAV